MKPYNNGIENNPKGCGLKPYYEVTKPAYPVQWYVQEVVKDNVKGDGGCNDNEDSEWQGWEECQY